MTLPPPPEYAYSQGEEYLEEVRSEITLNIRFCGIRGDKNILQSLKFSPWCLAEEAVEQVVPFFLKQDIIESATTEVETNFMSYSLFLGETYLHKDKSLVELKLEDGANVSLRYEGQNFTLVKVQLPPHLCTANSHFATFKVTPRTPVRSALKRLYLRFCEIHPDVLSYIISGPNPNAHAIDIDSFLFGPTTPAHVNAGNNTPPAPLRLVYRAPAQTDPVVTQRSLALTVIMRTTALPTANEAPAPAFRTVVVNFNPRDLVAKCVRQLDVVAGALDVFGHYGFYVIPPSDDDGEEHGYWLMENRTLGSYAISPEDTIEYRQHFRSYKIHLLDNTFVFHKFDEHATAKTLLTILIANQNLTSKSPRNFGLYPMPILGATGVNYDSPESALDPVRTLWSYDTILELRFREHLHPITVFFFERTQDTFLVDFSKTVSDLLPVILARFRIVLPSDLPADPSPVSLRKLGGSELDRSRSLRQHGISPGDGLLLKIAIGFESALGLEPSYEMPIYRRPPPPAAAKGPPRGTARVPPPRPSTPSNHTTNGNKGNTSPGPIPTKSLPPVPGDDVNIWEESNSDHVVFDANNKLQAGTLNKLVERLTSETVPDLEFMKAFLMTYQSYTTARKLLSKIFERFRVPSHVEANQKLSIQARVCNVIKYWVEHHYVDFNHHMTQEIVAFTDLEVAESLPPAAKQLRNAVLKRTCDIKHDVIKKSHEDGDLISSLPPVPPRPSPTNAFGKTASLPNLSSVLISPRDSPIASSLSPTLSSPLSALVHSQSPPSSPPISRLASVTSKAQRTLGVSKEKVVTSNNNTNNNNSNINNLNNSNNNFSSSSPQSPPSSTSLTTTLSFDKWRSKKKRGSLNLSKERSSSASPTSIWDFDEEEIAQQMTLIDFELYQSIRPTEFLNQAWNKPSTQNRSPNLLALIARSNLVGLWVSHQILREERLRGRAKKMDKLIKVAEHLYNLKNFASVMAFLGGLNNASVLRLKYTKAGISKRGLDVLEQLEKDMSSEGSFIKYRNILRNTTPPCMPYLGVHLSDLVFVDEGNPDTINSSKNNTTLVNFSKYHLIHKVISDTLQYQHTTYKTIAPVPFIQSFLRNLTPPLDKDLYAISLLREPRGASKAEIL